MTAPIYTDVITRFFNDVLDPTLKTFVFNGYEALAQHLKYPLGSAVVLFLMLMGISIMYGWIKFSISQFVKESLKIGLIFLLAMNWHIFSSWIVGGIQESAEQMGNWILTANPISMPQLAGPGIHGALQSVLIEVTRVAQWTWDQGSLIHNPGPYVTAIVIGLVGYALVILGLFEIIIAKIMLAILFVMAPLFISFTLFKATHGFFERWLGSILGFAFLSIFIMTALALAVSFLHWTINEIYLSHSSTLTLMGFVPILIVGGIAIFILMGVASMAKSLGGSISAVSGSELANGIAAFAGGSLGAMRGARKSYQEWKNSKNSKPAIGSHTSTTTAGIQSNIRQGK